MENKRAVGNTVKQMKENPWGFLAIATEMSQGGAILHQESQGLRSFVESDTLPMDIDRSGDDHNAKAILEAAGVKFLGPVEDDDLFQYVELPQGWKKVATEDSGCSNLMDDKGRVRASLFYKAASYDRKARLRLSTRFGVSQDYDRQKKENVVVARVMDDGKVVHTTEPIRLPTDDGQKYEVDEQARKAAVEWLDKNHADWRNPSAYWD